MLKHLDMKTYDVTVVELHVAFLMHQLHASAAVIRKEGATGTCCT
jgi:hypothetical protein